MGGAAVQEILERFEQHVGAVLPAADLVVGHAAEHRFGPPGVVAGLLGVADAFLDGGDGVDVVARLEYLAAEHGLAVDEGQDDEEDQGGQVGAVFFQEVHDIDSLILVSCCLVSSVKSPSIIQL